MADKLTQLVIDALTRAAADPAGTPLYATKTDAGLFPPSAAAKPAAKKCLDEGWLRVVRTDTRAKAPRELCAATDRGLDHLLGLVSPKQVLEDFVRVLEARRGEVADLVAAARRMADGLDGLTAAVAQVLPKVQAARVPVPTPVTPVSDADFAPSPSANGSATHRGVAAMPAVAACEAPAAAEVAVADDLADAVLGRLADWASSASAGQDCPLPDLFRSLTFRDAHLTIGTFHDCLRALHADGRVYLHPWGGPLYALPEPAYALLVGHGIAYYASPRS